MSNLQHLPPEIARRCVVKFKVGCEMAGVSPRHARRLIAEGKFPKPRRTGERADTFVIGEILDHIEAKKPA